MRELEQRTGVSREVIRIMIREGLLPEPVRPARNAAHYAEAHVRGVAAVRELQRSSRMTLKEIRQVLDGRDLGRACPVTAYPHLHSLLSGLFGLKEAPSPALPSQSPEATRDAIAFERLGMLARFPNEKGDGLSPVDARLVQIWSEIRAAGFVEETGFPPDNIAFYLKAAEFIADNEVEIFFRNSRGLADEERVASMLHTALPLMLEFLGILRLKAFIRALERIRGV